MRCGASEFALEERLEETVFIDIFAMGMVRQALPDVGWRSVHFAWIQALSTPLAKPENEGPVFVVAS